MFGDYLPIMEEGLFLCLLSKPFNILRMGIPDYLMPDGLFLAKLITIEETAGMDHFNDSFSIIFTGYPLPFQIL